MMKEFLKKTGGRVTFLEVIHKITMVMNMNINNE